MKIKPAKDPGNVIVEVGLGESRLLGTDEFHLKQILVPVDFSDPSQKALRYAVSFAKQFHASLYCLHITEIPYATGEMGINSVMENYTEQLREQRQAQMEELLRKEIPETIPSKSEIIPGTPYHEIVRVADENNIDLIVVSTHGKSGLSRILLGSTVERVVRHAPCPVLVVREREHEYHLRD
jgi:nucleotide-binding universal stress UspA family protein